MSIHSCTLQVLDHVGIYLLIAGSYRWAGGRRSMPKPKQNGRPTHPSLISHTHIPSLPPPNLSHHPSHSPFMMIALRHSTPANVLLVVEWVTAFIGICVSISSSGVDISNQATNLVEVGVPRI